MIERGNTSFLFPAPIDLPYRLGSEKNLRGMTRKKRTDDTNLNASIAGLPALSATQLTEMYQSYLASFPGFVINSQLNSNTQLTNNNNYDLSLPLDQAIHSSLASFDSCMQYSSPTSSLKLDGFVPTPSVEPPLPPQMDLFDAELSQILAWTDEDEIDLLNQNYQLELGLDGADSADDYEQEEVLEEELVLPKPKIDKSLVDLKQDLNLNYCLWSICGRRNQAKNTGISLLYLSQNGLKRINRK